MPLKSKLPENCIAEPGQSIIFARFSNTGATHNLLKTYSQAGNIISAAGRFVKQIFLFFSKKHDT